MVSAVYGCAQAASGRWTGTKKTFSWLLYLRFDDEGKIVTRHVVCGGVRGATVSVRECSDVAEQRGFTPTQKLQEDACFHVGDIVKKAVTPSFHFYSGAEFQERWQRGGQPVSLTVRPSNRPALARSVASAGCLP